MTYEVPIPVSRRRLRPLGRLDIVDPRTSRTQRALRKLGVRGFQPETTAALLAMWEHADELTFLDVGANGGLYANLCARLHPSARVVAFEPAPEIAEVARSIAGANDLSITVEELAVSDHEGASTLYLSETSDASNSLTEGFREAKGTLEVPVVTLDSYVASQGLAPSVVKIDVERHEDAVLDGAARTLADHRPAVVIEILPRRGEVDTGVVDRLEALGYVLLPLSPVGRDDPSPGAVRDWMCWPRPGPPRGFGRRLRAWQKAVARCRPGAEVNA